MTALFPTYPGLTWPIIKRPIWSTRIANHVSGKEVRAGDFTYPLYEFELTYSYLRASELQGLLGFFNQCNGGLTPFRFLDTTDDQVTGQLLGVGDGVTRVFTALRTIGGWVEPVGFVESIGAVYLSGSSAGGWTLTAPNAITFATAPGSGVPVSADFTFSYLCRFGDDQVDFENFLSGLWEMKTLKLRSVRS